MTCLFHEVQHDLKLITEPVIAVLTVEELKEHLRIDIADEDALIKGYIAAATKMVEEDAEVALMSQTWALYLDEFPDVIELQRLPVSGVTSIAYLDSSGVSQTQSASTYRVDAAGSPGRVTKAYGQAWPTTYPVSNAITVTFTAGASTRDAVPEIAKQAIRLLVGHWYRSREAVVSTGAQPIEVPLAYGACINRLRWSGVV